MDAWATPTPYPTSAVPAPFEMDFQASAVVMAEQSVSTWQMANQTYYLDWAITIVLMVATLRGMYSIFKQTRDL